MSAHPFAPGAIERHSRRIGTPAQRRELRHWLLAAALLAAIVFTLAASAGYFTTTTGA